LVQGRQPADVLRGETQVQPDKKGKGETQIKSARKRGKTPWEKGRVQTEKKKDLAKGFEAPTWEERTLGAKEKRNCVAGDGSKKRGGKAGYVGGVKGAAVPLMGM